MVFLFLSFSFSCLKTYPNLLVFGTSGQVFAIRTEADTTDVKIAILVDALVLESCDVLTGVHVKDLCRPVAARGQVLAITAETDAANNTVVDKVVHQLHVQNTLHLRVEDRVPVGSLTLLRGGKVIRVPVSQHVTRALAKHSLTGGRRARNLRRRARVRVSQLVRLLRGRRSRRRARPLWTRRGRGRRRRAIA